MLYGYHSNRLEKLLDLLTASLTRPLTDPFAAEVLVVQNQGMARWLAQGLAERTGIAANLDFPLPASFIWRLFGHWRDDLPPSSIFDREPLTWRILALFPGLLDDPGFAEPARYLQGEPEGLRAYQFARRIADCFDQYLVYRPEMILAWERGEGEHWQARLWRLLVAAEPAPHRARLWRDLARALAAGQPPRTPLPERVALFGLSALPPAYCELLGGVAAHTDLHLFVLNPCAEYWADLIDDRGRQRRRARALRAGLPDPTALLDLGNPLLASLGHQGQAFLDQVLEMGGQDLDAFVAPDPATLLGQVQDDILRLRDRRAPDPAARTLLDRADGSLQVQVCHSPLREVQVLHDRLLRLFEELPGLAPRDVLVMAPDIDGYAPFVDAVFGAAAEDRRIPWSIADRRLGVEQPVLAVFADLLDLPRRRLTVAEVLSWLEVPAVGRRFGIDERGLARVRVWVAESGVRWGLDGAMRGALELPAEEANTWAFGLRRLFLGFALPPSETLYDGVRPYPDLEGGEAELLGGLQGLITALGRWRERLARPRTIAAWSTAINRLIGDLIAPDEDEVPLLQSLRAALDGLREDAAAAGFTAPVERDLMRDHLADLLQQPAGGQRFLTGGVTFCNMVPMRSLPARVICLLGMNGSDFPRRQRPLGFDLIAQQPRRGDRSRRQDDRYLFLEALLSARDRLLISYQGRDARDNGIKVPAVVVTELLDYLDQSFVLPDGQPPSSRLLVEHPLQPFSRRYFDGADARLFSYADDWLAAARAEPGTPPPPFAGAPLAPSEESGVVDLADLIRFLQDPAAWFLRRRLRLPLPEEVAVLDESEPFTVAGLERWHLRQRLLGYADSGCWDAGLALLRGGGDLPHGQVGNLIWETEAAAVAAFRARLAPYRQGPRDRIELDLAIAGVRLQGWLDGLTTDGLVDQRLGRLRAKDLLSLWVRHLVLNRLAPTGIAPRSRFVGEDALLELGPVAEAEARLADLLDLWREGQCRPLPLFPETSLAFAAHGRGRAAEAAWAGGYRGPPGEGRAAAAVIAFRGQPDPLDGAFEALALRVFGPLLAAKL